jgi:hypothetical protein
VDVEDEVVLVLVLVFGSAVSRDELDVEVELFSSSSVVVWVAVAPFVLCDRLPGR